MLTETNLSLPTGFSKIFFAVFSIQPDDVHDKAGFATLAGQPVTISSIR
jgi:hypothetical protein